MPAPPVGEWEDDSLTPPPQDSKVVAIHACLLNDGKILYFHCRSYPFWTRLYDPENNAVILEDLGKLVVPKWPKYYDEEDPIYPIQPSKIFCSGHCFLPDGRLLVAGGELNNPYPFSFEPLAPDLGLRYSFIFDHEATGNYWSITGTTNEPHIMQKGRWYPTLTVLPDGNVLAMGGLTDEVEPNICPPPAPPFIVKQNREVEIYDLNLGWVHINDPMATRPLDIFYSYPDAHVIPFGVRAGRVFYGSTQAVPEFDEIEEDCTYTLGFSQIFNPYPGEEEPYWEAIESPRASPSEASAGVLLPIRLGSEEAICLLIGGAWGEPLSRIDRIDIAASTPVWDDEELELTHARYNHNAVLLPDRTLFVIGGEDTTSTDTSPQPVLIPELLDTDTMEWITLDFPIMPVARLYHSIAILLPDARILLGGGRVFQGGDVEDDTERRFSIFKPPYLLDGDRTIIDEAPDEIEYAEVFEVQLDTENYRLDSFALMKPGAVTHGNNMEQRYIELAFEPVIEGVEPTPGLYRVTAPDNSNIAQPGYYMLFAIKDKSESNSGVFKIPSKAKFVRLKIIEP